LPAIFAIKANKFAANKFAANKIAANKIEAIKIVANKFAAIKFRQGRPTQTFKARTLTMTDCG